MKTAWYKISCCHKVFNRDVMRSRPMAVNASWKVICVDLSTFANAECKQLEENQCLPNVLFTACKLSKHYGQKLECYWRGTVVWERACSGNSHENSKWWTTTSKQRKIYHENGHKGKLLSWFPVCTGQSQNPNVYKQYKRVTRWNANQCYSLRITYLIKTFQILFPTASLIFTAVKLFH